VVPEKSKLKQQIRDVLTLLEVRITHYFSELKHKLNVQSKRLINPKRKLEDACLRVDDLTTRLNRVLFHRILNERKHFDVWHDRLRANNPTHLIKNIKIKLDINYNNILKSYKIYNNSNRNKIQELTAKLQALSPMAILTRGYSVTRTTPGETVVTDPRTVCLDQDLEIIIALGRLYCHVKGKSTDDENDV
jgi:exodeoxyribonuclease VII large subunit